MGGSESKIAGDLGLSGLRRVCGMEEENGVERMRFGKEGKEGVNESNEGLASSREGV